MKRIVSIAVLFSFVVLLSDCKKKDDVIASIPSATLTIDGASKTVAPGSGILRFETQNGHEGRGLALTFAVGSDLLSVEISNWDFQAPPVNGIKLKSYTSDLGNVDKSECLALSDGITTLCDGMLVTYLVGTTTIYMSGFYDGEYEGAVVITACDPSKKLIAGTFDLKVADVDGNELLFKGSFTNISYTIQK